MSKKSGLPQKVIKHWFRNTLFKERQRSKDSPYNFSIPPSLGIDLEEYEKTGEAKVIPLVTAGEQVGTASSSSSSVEQPSSTSTVQQCPPTVKSPSLAASGNGDCVAEMTAAKATEEKRQRDDISPTTSVVARAAAGGMSSAETCAVSSVTNSVQLPNNSSSAGSGSMAAASTDSSASTTTLATASPAHAPPVGGGGGGPLASVMFGAGEPFVKSFAAMGTLPFQAPALANSLGFFGLNGNGGARRANRTRFTEQQVKVLQEFFEKNAYPKDDDLELLSKKLNLSPRVIVVWFQNARQKARKIYENQPADVADSDRLNRTPGLNYECKNCHMVFQRYYELIKHNKNGCGRAVCENDCKLEPELFYNSNNDTDAESSADEQRCNIAGLSTEQLKLLHTTGTGSAGADVAQASGDRLDEIAERIGASKRAVNVWLQNANRDRRDANSDTNAYFNKRCPFCGILFHNKQTMQTHFSERHAIQWKTTDIDVDALPDAEEVPTICTMPIGGAAYPMTNVVHRNGPTGSNEEHESEAPLDLTTSSNRSTRKVDEESVEPASGDESDGPSPTSQHRFVAQLSRPQKRFRTHLTPGQVKVMKYLFQDYKTPTMSECEMLGLEIGLHKRVVQVWFQNARAKERKAFFAGTVQNRPDVPASRCNFCNTAYTSRQTVQDHVFTKQHIDRQQSSGNDNKAMSTTAAAYVAAELMKDASTSLVSGLNPNLLPYLYPAGMMPAVTYYAGLNAPMMYPNGGNAFASGNLLYDVNVNGTPVSMLQVPATVTELISSTMKANRANFVRFTQDGRTVDDLSSKLSPTDRACLTGCDLEVGWACRKCNTVFQSEQFFLTHQRLLCHCTGPPFRLVQTHYECQCCSVRFGLQTEFQQHCETAEHTQKLQMQ
ncbi:homeobox domain protein [Trichinella nativa]|uniref:Homeobox domain protein n=1 Tax=Trichinella nativa TaxID=6335 RepID=A0A1Y3E9M8_9BILA|nr:homeobox domain protein [Trichinella nativa]